MASRREAGPPRGVLGRATPDGTIEHRRLLPGEALAPFVAHFWWVRWSLARPFVAETLPHPTVHLIFERGRAQLVGVPSGRFVRRLSGDGRVLGVKFRPGAFQPFVAASIRSMSALAGRTRPLGAALGDEGRAAARALREVVDVEQAIALVEPLLVARRPVLSAEVAAVRDLVERIEHDRAITRVEEAAALARLPVRTLERRFHRYLGVSPKAVIRRYRLIEAAEQLKRARPPSLATIAAALGYADQSHFVKDLRALVGRSPRALRAELAARNSR